MNTARRWLERLIPRLVVTLVVVVGAALTFTLIHLDRTNARNELVDELDIAAQTAVEMVHSRLGEMTLLSVTLANTPSLDTTAILNDYEVLDRRDEVESVTVYMPTARESSQERLTSSIVTAVGTTNYLAIDVDHASGVHVRATVDLEVLVGNALHETGAEKVGWNLASIDQPAMGHDGVTHNELLVVGGQTYRLEVWPEPGSRFKLANPLNPFGLGVVGLVLTVWAAWLARALVTRRQQAETRVAWSDEILDQVGAAVIFTDLTGTVSYWNRAAETLYGWTAGEAVGRPITDLTVPADGQADAEAIFEAINSEGSWEGEFNVVRRDGSVFPARVTDRALRDSAGRLQGIVGMSIDISDEHRIRDGLKQLVDDKNQFLAIVSHELRTPLTAVVGFAELLHRDAKTLSSSEIDDFHELIAQQALEVSDLVEDLLVLGRIESDALTIFPETLPVSVAVDAVVKSWAGDAGIAIDLGSEPLSVIADPLRTRQILRNLVANAVCHGGGPITVTASAHTKPDGPIVRIDVIDHGNGVPAESVGDLFQPYSAAAVRHGQPGSVGLGLYVSRRLAQLMDGDLTHTRDGGVTRFRLTLPQAVSTTDQRPHQRPDDEIDGSHIFARLPAASHK